MTSTGSINLIQDPMIQGEQTSSILQSSRPVSFNLDTQNNQGMQNPFSRTMEQFAEGTTDGGVLLEPNAFITWCICLNADYVSRILPRSHIQDEIVIRTVSHSLPFKRTSAELPHLHAIQWIESMTGLKQDGIGRLLGVTRQAVNMWKRGGRITDGHRRRLFAVRDVLERATRLHPTQEQLIAWLDTPRGADGRTPAQLLEANEINRARLLAVSSPSPRVVRAPSWINRSVPDTFQTRTEHRQEAWSPDVDKGFDDLINSEEAITSHTGEELPLT